MSIQKVGRYKIVRELGQGGQSIAYLAEDPVIGRMVAIKLMKSLGVISPVQQQEYMQRFLREAQAAGRLMHGNIAVIYDVGESDGLPFIAMEYIEGQTLGSLLHEEFPLPLPRVVRIMGQVLNGVSYAHKNNIIHRDIKPGNIMVTSNDLVKLVDFGIAKLDASQITSVGHILGTPSYMSPEQISGERVDRRSDIFSAGVVLYQCLAGRLPFDGEHATTVIYKILHEPYTPLEIESSHFPPQIDEILYKAMAKKPQDRYADCTEMENDLAALLVARRNRVVVEPEQEPTVSLDLNSLPLSPSIPSRRALFLSKKILVPAVSVLLLIAVLSFLSGFWHREGRGEEPASGISLTNAEIPSENKSESVVSTSFTLEMSTSSSLIATTSTLQTADNKPGSATPKTKSPIQVIILPRNTTSGSTDGSATSLPSSSIITGIPPAMPTTTTIAMTPADAAGTIPSTSPAATMDPSSTIPTVWRIPATHDHLVGGCQGTLIVTSEGLEFFPQKGNHYSKVLLSEINRLNWRDAAFRFRLSIQLKNGREVNYEAEGPTDKEQLRQAYEALLQNFLKMSR